MVDNVKKNVRLSPVVTYIAGVNDIYPNKVENILLALGQLSAYQDRHQGFKAGKYISVLRAFGFYSYQAFQEYKVGALASGISAPAGVCAAATGLASLAYLTEGAKIIDIVHHDEQHLYFQGPFSPPATGKWIPASPSAPMAVLRNWASRCQIQVISEWISNSFQMGWLETTNPDLNATSP